MKFSRKSRPAAAPEDGPEPEETPEAGAEAGSEPAPRAEGPFDIDEVDLENDGVERVDLGGLVLAAVPGLEVRLQVDQATEAVQSVMYAGPDGGVELRAFAAARGEDMWPEVRRQIAADVAQRGGTATEREGRWGTELSCQLAVKTEDGRVGRQDSRVVGISGPRWFLRVSFLGRPALSPESAQAYERAVTSAVVRRGSGAMAPGDPLPLQLPAQARRGPA